MRDLVAKPAFLNEGPVALTDFESFGDIFPSGKGKAMLGGMYNIFQGHGKGENEIILIGSIAPDGMQGHLISGEPNRNKIEFPDTGTVFVLGHTHRSGKQRGEYRWPSPDDINALNLQHQSALRNKTYEKLAAFLKIQVSVLQKWGLPSMIQWGDGEKDYTLIFPNGMCFYPGIPDNIPARRFERALVYISRNVPDLPSEARERAAKAMARGDRNSGAELLDETFEGLSDGQIPRDILRIYLPDSDIYYSKGKK
jgi:hypothetical protein